MPSTVTCPRSSTVSASTRLDIRPAVVIEAPSGPLIVPVAGGAAPALPADGWIEVHGAARAGELVVLRTPGGGLIWPRGPAAPPPWARS